MIKGRPCKIVEMSTSKTGKHGHAKVHMVALDIFTGKKLEDICPSTHNMDVPNVVRKDLQLVDIEGPDDELGAEIKERFGNDEGLIVSVLSAMDEERAAASSASSITDLPAQQQ